MIKELINWKEVTRGLFRYVIAAGACYEIHLEHHAQNTDINDAKASLYLVGDWCPTDHSENYFSRECLLAHGTVRECLLAASKDDAESNSNQED